MQEPRIGVSGTVKDEDIDKNYDYLQPFSKDNPDTIYKLLFEEYDEENSK